MSKQKKSQSSSGRTFKLIHQSLIISDVNFRKQTIIVSWGDRGSLAEPDSHTLKSESLAPRD